MTIDDERRALEREARYNQNLANLLTCMREGHEPDAGVGCSHEGFSGGNPTCVQYCKRCRLKFGVPYVPRKSCAEYRRSPGAVCPHGVPLDDFCNQGCAP